MNELLEEYNSNGYIILKNLLSLSECNELNEWLLNENVDKLTDNVNKSISIYENLLTKNSPFFNLINNKKLLTILKKIFNNNFKFHMIKVNNKQKFIGKDIEYHQEYYNQKYLHKNSKSSDYVQLFLALDKHTQNNGCLKIITKSHKFGILDSEEFINMEYNHKIRVSNQTLCDLTKKNSILDCLMEQGDLLIFDSLLVHGSASNKSNYDRKAVVCHVVSNNLIDDTEKTTEIYEYRKTYEIDILEKILKEKKNTKKKHVHKLISI